MADDGKVPRIKPSRHWARRIVCAGIAAVLVAAVSFVAAWLNLHNVAILSHEALVTKHHLFHLSDGINDSNAAAWGDFTDYIPPNDGWGRPYLLQSDENGLYATSYGRDGKPGGEGLDTDVSTRAPTIDTKGRTPFLAFLFAKESESVRGGCYAIGVVVFLLGIVLLRPSSSSISITVFVVSCIGAVGLAFVMAITHIPSGH